MEQLNQVIKITAIKGEEAAKETATLWTGRIIGKNPRKDLQLSAELPQFTAEQVPALDAKQIAILLNDEHLAYIRRVKCQRMEIGDSIELHYPSDATECASFILKLLTAPATREKKLVSTASIRALLLSSDYKVALAATLPQDKQEAWKRLGEREMLPLVVTTDASIPTARVKVRDAVVVRLEEIAAKMPEGEHKAVITAASELLAELEVRDLDDSI